MQFAALRRPAGQTRVVTACCRKGRQPRCPSTLATVHRRSARRARVAIGVKLSIDAAQHDPRPIASVTASRPAGNPFWSPMETHAGEVGRTDELEGSGRRRFGDALDFDLRHFRRRLTIAPSTASLTVSNDEGIRRSFPSCAAAPALGLVASTISTSPPCEPR